MSEVLVIGHRNPDTDAICAALGYAEFKRRTGMPHAVAARCGDINDRIRFVLQTFGVAPPRFVPDVSPKIRDVMQTNVISAPPRTPLVEALATMDERNIRVLPVVDPERRCLGLLSVFKASKFFFPSPNRIFDSRRVMASVRSLARVLRGRMLCGFEPDQEEDLTLMIGAMAPSSFGERLSNYPPEQLLVVVGDREEIQRLAIEARVRVVVITGGAQVDDSIRELAQAHEVSLVVSPHDTATTAMLCRSAISVENLLRSDYLAFGPEETLANTQPLAAASQFQAFPVMDEDRRIVGILTKSDFLRKVSRQLILVDHNELSQAVQGADQVEIIEIIDHHRLGPLTTAQPILFRNEPVGSTSTIVADLFFRHQIDLPDSIAGCLLAGLVSDTLNLTSPTTTKRDAEILAQLESITGIRATEFTEKLFASGSVLVSLPPSEAILADCKEYVEGEFLFSVAQIEELGFTQFWRIKAEVQQALEQHRKKHHYHFAALLVTDVVAQTSLCLIAGPPEFLGQIRYPSPEPGVFEMGNVVSRKKQLLPFLTQTLKHACNGETSRYFSRPT